MILFYYPAFSFEIDHFKGSWLCVPENSIGYNWDKSNSKWVVVNFEKKNFIFKTQDKCFGVKEGNPEPDVCGEIYELGKEPMNKGKPFYYFPRSDIYPSSSISGNPIGGEFRLSEEGEYILSYIMGEVGKGTTFYGTKNHKDSMSISVGICTKI